MMPSGGLASVRVAPTKASRASSSPVSIQSGVPPASSTAGASSSRFAASRIAAVATATHSTAPTSLAIRHWLATTSAVSSIFAAGISPPSRRLLPIRVNARWVTISRSLPLRRSATSSRVVLLPMSMQARTTRTVASGVLHDDAFEHVPDMVAGVDSLLQALSAATEAQLGVRGILELPEQAGDHERGLLTDVDGVVADALDAAGHEHHVHRPLALVRVVTQLEGELEAVAVQPVDLVVLADQILGERDVPALEGLLAHHNLPAGLLAHLGDVAEHALVRRRLVSGEGHQLGDVHALVAHPLHALDHMEDRRHEPEIGRHRRLQRQERQEALVDLQVAAVEPVVVLDHHASELDVLVRDRLQGSFERLDHHVEPAECLALEPRELFPELCACLGHQPNFPLT